MIAVVLPLRVLPQNSIEPEVVRSIYVPCWTINNVAPPGWSIPTSFTQRVRLICTSSKVNVT